MSVGEPVTSLCPMAAQCVLANINMDMVGEDTVKTNSRFYFTRVPDSVPFFLNA